MPWSTSGSGGGGGSTVAPTTVTGPNFGYSVTNAMWTDPQPLVLLCDSTAGLVLIVGPMAPVAGRQLVIKDLAGTALTNSISFGGNGKQIDGFGVGVTFTTDYQSMTLIYTGSKWAII